jgi:hypothetical protein
MEEGICILPYNKSIRAWKPNKANLQRVKLDGASDCGIQATNHPLKFCLQRDLGWSDSSKWAVWENDVGGLTKQPQVDENGAG